MSAPDRRRDDQVAALGGGRPRERLLACGVDALTDAELVALVLGCGTRGRDHLQVAGALLEQVGGLRGLEGAGLGELCAVPGIGRAQAMRLLAAIGLGQRVATARPCADEPICEPGDVYRRLAAQLCGLDRETFVALALDVRNRVVRELRVAVGSLCRCEVQPRDAFRLLVRERAAAVVFAHNHPSGDPTPSGDDLELTRRLADAGNLIGVPVLDHVIVAREGYRSLAPLVGIAP